MAQALIQIVIPFAAMFAIMYFLLILPEKKRSKKYNNMLAELKVNDEVLTRGGIVGKIITIDEDQLVIQRDQKTGMEFLINMDQPFSYNVTMTSELKNLLNDLSDKRNIDIKEIPLQGGLVVNRDPKTGLNYLSIKGNEAQGVSVIITSDKDIETLNKLADEFQKYPVSSQRSTAELYALLEISGNLKREKDGFTFLTPNGVTYIPYDGYSSKAYLSDRKETFRDFSGNIQSLPFRNPLLLQESIEDELGR